ncbi:FK506-binding protein 59kD isoform X2 [Nomia melanderi]|uniref:FK506-binding protein 59kD isoform X2 n=1 Tax=Nomia melanderi TaxID=2448451 RepID=UPI0013045B26|nr:FK506-binding protein 59 isoform X2 [Nomia melanderi]
MTVTIDISPKQDGKILKEIIREGVGDETPSAGSNVTVHYVGTLLDGTKIDSSRDRNEPFKFELKKKSVIKVWDIGVATMKKGEIAVFTCDPKYGYGAKGSPPDIPPNATLKFEIEMLDWKDEDLSPEEDGSIERYQIVEGKHHSTPQEGVLVNIHLTGMYNGKVFEDRDVQFTLGEGEEYGIVEGVEKALEKFKSGEKSRLRIKSKYAFKDEPKPEFNIPPNATVEYIVELKSFEKSTEMWTLKNEELIEQAKIFKEKGTNYFKANKYSLASNMYRKSASFMTFEGNFKGDLKTERDNLLLSANLNLALCYLKLDRNVEAKDVCNKALELSPQNEKALFRRGQAYLALASPEIAIKDFQTVLEIEPKNTAASKQIAICKDLIKKQLEKEKNLYVNMFDKFAQEDKQEEEKLRDQSDVMNVTLGEWGQEERPGGRDATAFEKENPNILMLNANGTGEFQDM